MNGLPEHEPDEPPHPPFWSKKWPCPRFGRREPHNSIFSDLFWYESAHSADV